MLNCLFFSFILLSCLLPHYTALSWFSCFYRSQFCSPAINQISLSQSKGWFPFIFADGKNIPTSIMLVYQLLYQHDFRIILTYVFVCPQIFHWRVEKALSVTLSCITSCEDHELWKLGTIRSTCYNWELLIAHPHSPLCFKKIWTTTTTVFLILKKVVPNPYSNSTVLIFNLSHPIPGPFNRSLSVWYSNTVWPSNK